jgi:hypothetical protein
MTTRDPVENLKLAASCAAFTIATFALGCGVGYKYHQSSAEPCNGSTSTETVSSTETVLRAQPLPGTGQLEYGKIFEMDGASRDR